MIGPKNSIGGLVSLGVTGGPLPAGSAGGSATCLFIRRVGR